MAEDDQRRRVALLKNESTNSDENVSARRAEMVRAIEADVQICESYLGKSALNARVMTAMGKVPRHEFVAPSQEPFAYVNNALPIGHGQTISQPFIVALMTDLARVRKDDVVLEVGSGCGYQAAVLAELAAKVHGVEIVEALAAEAGARLQRLGYGNVEIRAGDGYAGWPEHAPFDAIIVTAAAEAVPPPLIAQLGAGGRLVIPLGAPYGQQWLTVVAKDRRGDRREHRVLPVAFVPFVHV
jgi:protein-L-isoaspartate(D-aspartate) O-methyltransferase